MTNPTSRLLRAEREENAHLKAEVESLKKPAVIGGYNISEYIRMANSETLEFDNGDFFADMTLPERIKYIVESHARLQAEVDLMKVTSQLDQRMIRNLHQTPERSEIARLTADYRKLEVENSDLRAEVERLGAFRTHTIIPNEILKAEVERLENLVRYWSEKYQNENARFLRASERIAAKEGKQS